MCLCGHHFTPSPVEGHKYCNYYWIVGKYMYLFQDQTNRQILNNWFLLVCQNIMNHNFLSPFKDKPMVIFIFSFNNSKWSWLSVVMWLIKVCSLNYGKYRFNRSAFASVFLSEWIIYHILLSPANSSYKWVEYSKQMYLPS